MERHSGNALIEERGVGFRFRVPAKIDFFALLVTRGEDTGAAIAEHSGLGVMGS